MAEHERFQIHPDAVRAAADVIEALPNIGLTPSLVHIEEAGFTEIGQHFIVNIDAVQPDHEPAEHPDALQRKLNQIDDSTTDHAAEVAVTAPEAPMYPEEQGPAYWDLEALIRITEQGG